jgi:hypothetical protein
VGAYLLSLLSGKTVILLHAKMSVNRHGADSFISSKRGNDFLHMGQLLFA